MNISILKGNFTADPEVRYMPSGNAVCDFTLAWNNSYKNAAGKKVDDAHFFDFTAFGATAETIGKFFKKGKPILVTSRADQQRWEAPGAQPGTKVKRSRVRFVVERFDFVGDIARREDAPPADYDDEPASEHDAHGVDIRQPAAPLPPTVNPPPAAPVDPAAQPVTDDIPF